MTIAIRECPQQVILETCDLQNIWPEWWENMGAVFMPAICRLHCPWLWILVKKSWIWCPSDFWFSSYTELHCPWFGIWFWKWCFSWAASRWFFDDIWRIYYERISIVKSQLEQALKPWISLYLGKVGGAGFSKLPVGYFTWNACWPQPILGEEKLSGKKNKRIFWKGFKDKIKEVKVKLRFGFFNKNTVFKSRSIKRKKSEYFVFPLSFLIGYCLLLMLIPLVLCPGYYLQVPAPGSPNCCWLLRERIIAKNLHKAIPSQVQPSYKYKNKNKVVDSWQPIQNQN